MGLPPIFPLFPDGPNGPYHVSLSLPGAQSEILKSVGQTASALLLVPQADYIKKFVEGDLDIGDSVIKGMLSHNFSTPAATKDEEVFKKFAKLSKIEITDINKYKKNGKFVMPTSEIKLSPEWENIGLSSVEKTTLKSIFETQKPYIEIAKLVLENIAYVEDIVARVMPLISLNPFTCKSEKPNSNSGKNKRPKAMGFNNGDDFKKELSKIETLINDQKPKQKLKLDLSVVENYFKLTNIDNQKRATQSERDTLSKYTILIALFQKPENFFDFVYGKIVDAKGVESTYKSEIQNFLNGVSSTYKDLKLYQTNQPINKVSLGINDVIDIVKSAENKYKFKNNQNIPNSTYLNIYRETALKFYKEKVPLSMIPDDSTDDPNTSATNGDWKIINTVYSTGEFKPDVEYNFKYVDLPKDEPEFNEKKSDLNLNDNDPYHKYKPKKLIFGIYKSDGSPLNPTENLKTIGLNGNDVVQSDTPFKKADWLLRSPKWYLPTGVYQWPVYSEPYYIWERNLIQKNESKTNPDTTANPPWRIRKYKKGDKDLISNEDAIPGSPVIARIEKSEETEYRDFFNDFLKFKFYKTDTLSKAEKDKSRIDIMSRLNVKSHVTNVFNFGQVKSSYYKPINDKDPIPDLLKKTYKPYKIFSTEASVDQEIRDFSLSENLDPGYVWIEPEADYDMKVIRIDPSDKIKYFDAKGEPEVTTQIKNFIKNRTSIRLSNNEKFTIEIQRINNNVKISSEIYQNVTSYSFDNWNYKNSKVFNSDIISISVYSNKPPSIYDNIKYKTIEFQGYGIELKKEGDDYYYRKKKGSSYSFFTKGDLVLWSIVTGTSLWSAKYSIRVSVDDKGKITRWYYQKDRKLSGPTSKLGVGVVGNVNRNVNINKVLPTFGVIREFVINQNTNVTLNVKDYDMSYSDKDISLYSIKVSDTDPSGKIIDPSKITNDQLVDKEIFGYGRDGLLSKYGHGSEEEPQELLIINRYRLTDLDSESYYIVEGTLRNPPKETELNLPNVAAQAASGEYYRLPDAIGSMKVFLSLLANIFSKLLPQIIKLISLLKNPMSFITDIITEKLQESVSFLSKESLNTFKTGSKLKEELDNEKDINEKKKKVRDMKKFYKSSPLSNYVFVKDDGKALSILDGASLIPFGIFGSNFTFGMEMNLGGLIDKKNPLKLIFEKDLNLKNLKNLQKEFELKKIDKKQPSLKSSLPNNPNETGDFQVKFDDGSEKTIKSGSYDQFIADNKNRFNFVYLDENKGKTYKKIDEYIQKGTAEDLRKAKELLDKAKKENPLDNSLMDKMNLLKGKLEDLQAGEQPMLKFILGLVTLPVKIISGMLEWLFSFFKSLINPLTLPTKIIELVSFQWVMQFFTPKGILEMGGIKFKPEKPLEWATKVNIPGVPFPNIPKVKSDKLPDVGKFDIPNPDLPKFTSGNMDTKLTDVKKNATDLKNNSKITNDLKSGVTNVPSPSDLKSGLGQVPAVDSKVLTDKVSGMPNDLKSSLGVGNLPPVDVKSNLNSPEVKVPDLPKSLELPEDIVLKGYDRKTIKSGDFLAPDDGDLADLSEFLSVIFNIKLPTYSALQFRQNTKLPLPLLSSPGGGGFLCLIEKIINAIIDFFWATLGIEALIPPPHIKLCDQKSPNDAAKIKDNTGVSSNGVTASNTLDGFFYEVVLSNGETKKFLNQEELQSFIDDNKDLNYDFNF